MIALDINNDYPSPVTVYSHTIRANRDSWSLCHNARVKALLGSACRHCLIKRLRRDLFVTMIYVTHCVEYVYKR